jgi:3-deoxy-manno-octulosonate cytidylyltransferase (CMP-KDO synthetase)
MPVSVDRALSIIYPQIIGASAMAVVAVIPARYSSTRLPGKALAIIGRVPMIVRVWRQTRKARIAERVIVATDDERILHVMGEVGGEVMMTSPDHQSGTDRIAEIAARVMADIYINVQGDQPFIAPDDLEALAAPMLTDATLAMATLAAPITSAEEWNNPNKVKVVCDARNDALYFSRSPIPFARDKGGEVPPKALRHIGVYAYRRGFLLKFASMEPGVLEQIERLEQLRALERGYRIRVVPSVAPSLEVDTPEDLVRADAWARDHKE